jgi:hypothetical protein
MGIKAKKKIRKAANRTYLARDFESFRNQLLRNARTFFPDKIQDFSEPSVGGLFLDMAATIGDSLSYYLDHQFKELDPFLAVEPENIRTHMRNAGVEMHGASPASVTLKLSFDAAAEQINAGYRPDIKNLPVVLSGTRVKSVEGVVFSTVEDLDFAEVDNSGFLVCDYEVKTVDSNGAPMVYNVFMNVEATSGEYSTDSVTIPDSYVPFREVALANQNVSTILSVMDSNSDEYYEVKSLNEANVFAAVSNIQSDYNLVPSNLEIIPAPKRYIKKYDPSTKLTTIQFGSGDADTLDDDVLPDPSDLSLPLYGKKNFSRFSIDPNALLKTHTLGISPRATTLSITYLHGGGLSHNVSSNTITQVTDLMLEFRKAINPSGALQVRQTMAVDNPAPAVGGATAPTLEEMKRLIPIARQSQGRVVTKEDLLARVYTMPARFGRVYRAGIAPNPVNPLSTTLYIISQDKQGNLITAPDTLKKNLSIYLNQFRLISDAIDVLDTRVINFGVRYSVIVASNVNKVQIVQAINNRIAEILQKQYFQIDQPLVLDDITNIIINTDYVISLIDLQIFPRTGTIEDRTYSASTFPFERSNKNGILFGPTGFMFELRFPENDIIGSAS